MMLMILTPRESRRERIFPSAANKSFFALLPIKAKLVRETVPFFSIIVDYDYFYTIVEIRQANFCSTSCLDNISTVKVTARL